MNVKQAFKLLCTGNDVVLTCKYYERIESHTFQAKNFNIDSRDIGFRHQVECIKNDFKDISTYYRGNKSDCVFIFSAA